LGVSGQAGAYMDGKDAFVRRVEGEAVAWVGGVSA